MFVDLTITSLYGDAVAFEKKLIANIGKNMVIDMANALQGTIFQNYVALDGPQIIAVEQMPGNERVIYFLQGNDTIKVHIVASTVVKLKKETVRITRQIANLIDTPGNGLKAEASMFVAEVAGFDVLVIMGERVGRLKQFGGFMAEKWLTRLASPMVIFAGASIWLQATTAPTSAWIGLLAAGVSFLLEAAVFVYSADDWKWKDTK